MAVSGIGGSSLIIGIRRASTPQSKTAEKLLPEMDADQDGSVSKSEFVAFGEKLQANGPKGSPPSAATPAAGSSAANRPARPSADQLFASADKDGSGSLGVSELSAFLAEGQARAAVSGAATNGKAAGNPGKSRPSAGGGPPPGGRPPAGGKAGGKAASAGQASGGSSQASSKSSASAESDPADTNGDGTVSAAEKLLYELTHANSE